MKAVSIKQILLVALVSCCCLILANCSDDKVQDSSGPRVVGDLDQTAVLLEIILPEDCDESSEELSAITGRVNNVDLNQVKVVMYNKAGSIYGNIREFESNGSFAMDLPCDRRVRLVLADSDWDAGTSYTSGPPTISDTILAVAWDIDRVVGTITGVVKDPFDNSALVGVDVSWTIDGATDQDITGAGGGFTAGESLDPGTYTLTFSKTDYAALTVETLVPTLDSLRSDNNPYPGDLQFIQDLEVLMPPLSASLSGYVRRIDPAFPNDTVAAVSVEVQLLLNDNIAPNILRDTTDSEGHYSFENIPAADTLSLVVPSFVVSPYTFGPADTTLELVPGSTVIDAVLSASGGGVFRLISDPMRR